MFKRSEIYPIMSLIIIFITLYSYHVARANGDRGGYIGVFVISIWLVIISSLVGTIVSAKSTTRHKNSLFELISSVCNIIIPLLYISWFANQMRAF